jgi:hypothetical protein
MGVPDEIRPGSLKNKWNDEKKQCLTRKEKKLCVLNSSKVLKAQTFVWEPIEGFNLEHRLFTSIFVCP